MSFTYTIGTDIARVRARIDDTDEQRALFSDEEIQDALDTRGGVAAAAAMLARQMYARASKRARNYSNAEGSVDETGQLDHLRTLMESLEAEAAEATPSASLPLAEVTALGRAPNDPLYLTGG